MRTRCARWPRAPCGARRAWSRVAGRVDQWALGCGFGVGARAVPMTFADTLGAALGAALMVGGGRTALDGRGTLVDGAGGVTVLGSAPSWNTSMPSHVGRRQTIT